MNEHRGDRVEPHAAPVIASKERSTDFRIVEMVGENDRPSHLSQLGFPSRRVSLDPVLEVGVAAEQIGADDFQPRVDIHLALRAVVVLIERSMTVMK